MRGEVITLLKWIEAVEPHSQTHPWLAILKAWALTLTGHLDRVEQTLQTAEQLISSARTDHRGQDDAGERLQLLAPIGQICRGRPAWPQILPGRRWNICPIAILSLAVYGVWRLLSWEMPVG